MDGKVWQRGLAAVFLAILIAISTEMAGARVIHVPGDYQRIEDASEEAHDGDEIIVAPGIYKEMVGIYANIILRSTFNGDWSTVRNTVIDGEFQHNVIGLTGDETSQSLIRGFTIRNGNCGISGGRGSRATIEYCIFQNNQRVDGIFQMRDGGAMRHTYGLIQNNIFENNLANFGGALSNCHGVIQNNLFYNNVTFYGNDSFLKTDNKITDGYGGALYSCNGIIRNNTFVDNYRLDPTGPKPGGLYNCHGTIVNNIIYHTTMTAALEYENCSVPSYCFFRTLIPGLQNLAGDPRFLDPAAHDYRLAPDSPCIDAGARQNDLACDLYGIQRGLRAVKAARGDGSCLDIGAAEALPRPVAVWLPYGGPPGGIREGQPLNVAWAMDPAAGSRIQLRLFRAGRFFGELGIFTAPSGSATNTVQLPASMLTRADYAIVGVSTANGSSAGTPPFTITGTAPPNAVSRTVWRGYP